METKQQSRCPHLPEENLETSKSRETPGKPRNWSGIHSSPANMVCIDENKYTEGKKWVCTITSIKLWTSSPLHSFSLHKVFRSCKSTSGSSGRDLALLWLRRDVLVGGLWTLLMADSKRETFKRIRTFQFWRFYPKQITLSAFKQGSTEHRPFSASCD